MENFNEYDFDQAKENLLEYRLAEVTRADKWVVAHDGTEVPIRYRDGRTYLYVFNHATGKHGFLDMGTDIVRMDHPEM